MKNVLLAGIALFAVSSQAQAQDKAYLTPATGLYVGATAGYGWQELDVDGAGDVDLDGFEYGGFIGFQVDAILDRTINRLGLGVNGAVEAYYNDSNSDGSSSGVDLEKNYDWGINFRPGLTFLDAYSPFGIKPYGILGYRQAEFEADAGGVSGDETYHGFELGIGTEVVAYDAVGIRVDYTHVFYGEEDGIDPDENNVRVGVAYHF